jgi:hypothetical protein
VTDRSLRADQLAHARRSNPQADTDRLAQIRASFERTTHPAWRDTTDVGWLLARVDQLTADLAKAREAAKQRSDMLEEARDLLESNGHPRVHGDDWPDIIPAITALIAERDRLREAVSLAQPVIRINDNRPAMATRESDFRFAWCFSHGVQHWFRIGERPWCGAAWVWLDGATAVASMAAKVAVYGDAQFLDQLSSAQQLAIINGDVAGRKTEADHG